MDSMTDSSFPLFFSTFNLDPMSELSLSPESPDAIASAFVNELPKASPDNILLPFKNESPDINIIYTQNKSIVFIIKEFIVHDMYLIDVEENLVEQMKYIYGKGFKRLKDKVLGTNSTYRIH